MRRLGALSFCARPYRPPSPSPSPLQEAMTASSASSHKTLSKIASNRLQKELVEWQVNPPAGFKHKVTDNLQRWVIDVNGAHGTLYANETYQLQVDFPGHYPMEAPQVIFLQPAPLHPHIYSNGHICLGNPEDVPLGFGTLEILKWFHFS
ncbi:ubiquitin-conjugating enzyme 16 [Actinidia rufa]|uniref:Ubiquitin-conjugating enzyme 16 n=1 Tax=Actinidia rufa TaxID=165716 RepID=A0A7J0EGF9_9ERIC|nr:ubiquitin-conjugating enzyme 16 [Actinidia rufa]